jgi:hypothetical protein
LGGAQEAILNNRADLMIGLGDEPVPGKSIKYQQLQ